MARPPMTDAQRAAAVERRRSAVLVGLATSINAKGYAATTIADIASAGGVSKSAVYDHFHDKEAVFLALYAAATGRVIEVVRERQAEARAAGLPWEQQVGVTLRAYLQAMEAGKDLTRCLLVEAPAVSPAARRLRRSAIDDYGAVLLGIAAEIAEGDPELSVPDATLVPLVIGGLQELILQALEQDDPWDLDAMTALGAALLISSARGRLDAPPA
ncbi:MAG: TetR/AcrR family transcriptional regulator [Solirubrobacteraceae bacterium]|nr:TetR/AcrR family transcriptional regulator [Solirubrobacteraceae bacterium]